MFTKPQRKADLANPSIQFSLNTNNVNGYIKLVSLKSNLTEMTSSMTFIYTKYKYNKLACISL